VNVVATVRPVEDPSGRQMVFDVRISLPDDALKNDVDKLESPEHDRRFKLQQV
jgi:hypothetical protein